jgi:hypothetical protein
MQLRGTIVIEHGSREMNNLESAILGASLLKIFGGNKAAEVIANSDLYKEDAAFWNDRACFGCFYLEYSVLVIRIKSTELQASIELEGSPSACERAMQSALEGLLEALGPSNLNMSPKPVSLEITPFGDTHSILLGQTSTRHHLQASGTIQVLTAALAALGAGIAGSLLWEDQAAGIWAGALPSFTILAVVLGTAAWSVRMKKIIWSMVD